MVTGGIANDESTNFSGDVKREELNRIGLEDWVVLVEFAFNPLINSCKKKEIELNYV